MLNAITNNKPNYQYSIKFDDDNLSNEEKYQVFKDFANNILDSYDFNKSKNIKYNIQDLNHNHNEYYEYEKKYYTINNYKDEDDNMVNGKYNHEEAYTYITPSDPDYKFDYFNLNIDKGNISHTAHYDFTVNGISGHYDLEYNHKLDGVGLFRHDSGTPSTYDVIVQYKIDLKV